MKYSQLHIISGSHKDSINCLSFSPNGRYLASGGDDNGLFVIDHKDGRELAKITSSSQVTAILWHPSKDALWIGHANGDVQIVDPLKTTGSNLPIGISGPVECLAFEPEKNLLAIGIAERVIVLHYTEEGISEAFLTIQSSISLKATPTLGDRCPRSLHFIKRGNYLVVSYLEHGVLCWNLNRNKREWDLRLRTPRIGRSAISSDDRYLVVSNLYDGFDVYDLENHGEHVHTLGAYIMENVPLPVLFIHGNDDAILVGSSHGAVKIFDQCSGNILHNLPHKEWAMVQAIAYHHDISEHSHFIATGTSEKGAATYLTIWKARAIEERVMQTSTLLSQDRAYGPLLRCARILQTICYLFLYCVFAFLAFHLVRTPHLWWENARLKPIGLVVRGLLDILIDSVAEAKSLWLPLQPPNTNLVTTCSSPVEGILTNTCPFLPFECSPFA